MTKGRLLFFLGGQTYRKTYIEISAIQGESSKLIWLSSTFFCINLSSIPELRNILPISQIQLKGIINFAQRHHCCYSLLTAPTLTHGKSHTNHKTKSQAPPLCRHLPDEAGGMHLLDGAVVNLWLHRDSELAPSSCELPHFYRPVQHQKSKYSCHYMLS